MPWKWASMSLLIHTVGSDHALPLKPKVNHEMLESLSNCSPKDWLPHARALRKMHSLSEIPLGLLGYQKYPRAVVESLRKLSNTHFRPRDASSRAFSESRLQLLEALAQNLPKPADPLLLCWGIWFDYSKAPLPRPDLWLDPFPYPGSDQHRRMAAWACSLRVSLRGINPLHDKVLAQVRLNGGRIPPSIEQGHWLRWDYLSGQPLQDTGGNDCPFRYSFLWKTQSSGRLVPQTVGHNTRT
ncbi:MAG: hypothetical protein [Arizlama microvirus]|nr:MAG: hypothetical protein [Arizlama microvirus]